MERKYLVVPDKFKGCLSAREVGEAIATGIRRSGAVAEVRAVADGGDGSVAAAVSCGFRPVRVEVCDAIGRPHQAEFAIAGSTAIVEIANTCGLSLLESVGPATLRRASSFGLGLAIRRAAQMGAMRIVLALGGSASIDGGAGMLSALGAELTGGSAARLRSGEFRLSSVSHVDLRPLEYLRHISFVVATDVSSSLLGPSGAAQVFGPQKGASPVMVRQLDHALERWADLLESAAGRSGLRLSPGAGSAGGVGFAALAALRAEMVSGADFFLDLTRFDQALSTCDAVVTGEGSFDAQSLLGKLPIVIARRSSPRSVHLVVGRNLLAAAPEGALFESVHAVSDMDLNVADTSRDPAATYRGLIAIGQQIGSGGRADVRA